MLDTIRANVLHKEKLQRHEQVRAETEDLMRAESERFRKEGEARQPKPGTASAKSKQPVYKDFSQLNVMKRIDLTAVAIFEVHRALEMEKAFEPRPGTQLHRIWKMKKLTMTQQRGWIAFRQDAQSAYGKSGNVTSPYGEITDGGGGDSFKVPTAFVNEAHRRIEYMMYNYLITDEALLLRDLIKDDVQNHENFNIELVGFLKSNYKKEETARANGIGHVQALLTRVGRFYRF